MRWLLLLCLAISPACSERDSSGQALTDIESRALATCNEQLATEFKGRLGSVTAREAVILAASDKVEVGWEAQTGVGRGEIICTTDNRGVSVQGWLIDGLKVRP